MKYQNIVVAIDGSQPAEKAFRKAIEIAKRNQARLILAHVIDDRRVGRVEIYSPTFFKKLEEKMRRILSDYKLEAENRGVPTVEICVEFGSPKKKIVNKIIPEYKADLIVCGSTGTSALERWMLGSVSEQIARSSDCDVFIVK